MIRARGRATWAWVSWCQVLCRINPFSLLCGWYRDSCCKGKKWGLGEGVYSNNLREAVSVPKPEPFLIHPGGSCVGTQLWLVTRLTPKQKTCENRWGWLWPHLYETKDIKLCLRFDWWIDSTSWGKKMAADYIQVDTLKKILNHVWVRGIGAKVKYIYILVTMGNFPVEIK